MTDTERRLLPWTPKHVTKNYRSWLMFGTAEVGLVSGMVAAELRQREKEAAEWIAAHQEQARELSKQVERGDFGNLRA